MQPNSTLPTELLYDTNLRRLHRIRTEHELGTIGGPYDGSNQAERLRFGRWLYDNGVISDWTTPTDTPTASHVQAWLKGERT